MIMMKTMILQLLILWNRWCLDSALLAKPSPKMKMMILQPTAKPGAKNQRSSKSNFQKIRRSPEKSGFVSGRHDKRQETKEVRDGLMQREMRDLSSRKLGQAKRLSSALRLWMLPY